MNQKKAKKLRQLLKNAVTLRDNAKTEDVVAPGVVKAAPTKTPKTGYVEQESRRKRQNVPLTENELVEAAEATLAKDIERLKDPKFYTYSADIKSIDSSGDTIIVKLSNGSSVEVSKTPPPKHKTVIVAPGTIMVASGTIRGTYLSMKKSLDKRVTA